MMKEKLKESSVNPVDHEDKVIETSEDFVTDEPTLVKKPHLATQIMNEEAKQVSAEIDRNYHSKDLED